MEEEEPISPNPNPSPSKPTKNGMTLSERISYQDKKIMELSEKNNLLAQELNAERKARENLSEKLVAPKKKGLFDGSDW